jgi:protein involved in polysaccharide export with SLBB domain
MDNTTEVSVSHYEVSKAHNINLTHSMSTHENNYNIMKQPNDLAIKDLDDSEEDIESDSDYQPSAGDQSEVTESDTEEHGSEDKMDLDEEVRILQEEARAAQNSPTPSSDQL